MTALILMTTGGCDETSLQIAREAADRQAEQNRTMAELQQEVAEGTNNLIVEEGKARQQTLSVHRDLQAERAQLGKNWNQLEAERQSIARQRRTDSFLSSLASGGAAVLAGLLALAFAWRTMHGLAMHDESAQDACELLIEDLVADSPRLTRFPGPPPREIERLAPPADIDLSNRPQLPSPDPSLPI